jgi:protein arginine kinase activator
LNNPSETESPEAPDELSEAEASQLEVMDHLLCPNCGISFREFRSQGRLGCPHDYIAFEKELMPLLENIHGATQHVGKYPKRAPNSSQQQFKLIKLRNELRSAVDDEDYERAARLRDEIQALETQLSAEEPETPA